MSAAKAGVGVGDLVMVRLALAPGMPAEDPTADEMIKMRASRDDPTLFNQLLAERRQNNDQKDLSADSLSEQFWLYPRRRAASVAYVDLTGGGTDVKPSGAPGAQKPSAIGFINLTVKTVGSTVMQPAIGHYPKWAQETFRLDGVQWFDEEPADMQDQHVAYPVPAPDAKPVTPMKVDPADQPRAVA